MFTGGWCLRGSFHTTRRTQEFGITLQIAPGDTARDARPTPRTRPRFSRVRRLRGEGTEARRAWRSAYVRSIVVGDAVCAALAAVIGYFVRFGTEVDGQQYSLTAALLMPVLWLAAMHIGRTYEERYLWVGADEFRRVLDSAALLLAAVAVVAWGLDLAVARGFVVVALPVATVLTLLLRYVRRQRLHRARAGGAFQQTTVIVGHRGAVASLHAQLDRAAYHGYRVIGCCLPDGRLADGPTDFDGLPVLGGLTEVLDVVRRYEVDTVAVMPCPELDGPELRRLGWALEQTEAELLLAPAVTEVVGPRVAIRPVCGLPLLHVERPELRGVRRLGKSAVDVGLAVGALLVTLPLFLGIALAVTTTSRGPVFFKQTRVGRDGRTFSMLKFRSMVTGADRMVEVLGTDNDGNGVLYKRKADPRVTRVGRVLRRYSLDELPQLLNVLRGDMSLVGPRPPLPSETERYGFDMRRRFLVKPGITGLWQISGRSDLSWDDSVRIDVRYVENWSLSFDMMILWKTLGAVIRGRGAY